MQEKMAEIVKQVGPYIEELNEILLFTLFTRVVFLCLHVTYHSFA